MKKLLFSVTKNDLEIETFRSGGKGGQNQNKRDTGVRIRHRKSGAVGEARDQRSQDQNKKSAFKRMVESKKFQIWLKKEAWKQMGLLNDVGDAVDEQMKHIKIESKDQNGRWVEGLTEENL